MKIKLLVSRVGSSGCYGRGEVIEVGDAEALRMIESEQAIPFDEPKSERAIKTTPAKEKR